LCRINKLVTLFHANGHSFTEPERNWLYRSFDTIFSEQPELQPKI
jgi:hypothetical protein